MSTDEERLEAILAARRAMRIAQTPDRLKHDAVLDEIAAKIQRDALWTVVVDGIEHRLLG